MNCLVAPAFVANTSGIVKAGYLMKKGSGRIASTWSRRWFMLKGDFLLYTTRGKDEAPTIAANLRVTSVRPTENADRRFCFDVITPNKYTHHSIG